jgi:DNA-binding MarR family transcriptional regulator
MEATENLEQRLAEILLTLSFQAKKTNRELSASLGLTVNELHSIIVISSERPGRVCTLAGAVGLSVTSISKVLRTLEKKGLITRIHGAEDHREEIVQLTDKGAKVMHQLLSISHDRARYVLGNIPTERWTSFLRCMRVLSEGVPTE